MTHYFDLVRPVLDLISRRWTYDILIVLSAAPLRRSRLRAALGGVSDKVLTDTLRLLERQHLVERQPEDGGVTYGLTFRGEDLVGQLELLGLALDESRQSGSGVANRRGNRDR